MSMDVELAALGTSPADGRRVKLVLSVDGMTCAACPAGISRVVAGIEYVQDFSISLLEKSCRMIVPCDKVEEIRQILEDTGYDVEIVSEEQLSPQDKSKVVAAGRNRRSVDISISGMFCDACPSRVKTHLLDLDWVEEVEVHDYKSNEQVIKLSYTPNATTAHTIRDLRTEIEGLGFGASIYHRPLAAELANRKAEAEIARYLVSVLLSLIIVIPTFVVGIALMDLAPAESSSRRYIMGPVVGRLSRGVLTLFILATPVEFGIAWIFHEPAYKGLKGLWRRHNNKTSILSRLVRFGSMNLLISLGISVAYFASLALLIISAREHYDGTTEDVTYFDSVVFLDFFILIGRLIEVNSKKKMKDAVALLGQLRPQEASLLSNSEMRTVPTSMLELGDLCLVPLGSSPPVDGIISEGSTHFNEASLSGEAKPVFKTVGDRVFAGTINADQQISMKVTSVEGSNVLDDIARVISEGTTHRARIERFGDILTSYFVPMICLISVCVFALWLGLSYGGIADADLDYTIFALRFSISVFVIACPCGIGLAAPTASAVGSALCARLGILASGGSEAYADASKIAAVVFDKTGTLTSGNMKVSDIKKLQDADIDDDMLWSAVLLCEQKSNHPIATCLIEYLQSRPDLRIEGDLQITDHKEMPGQGMQASISTPTTTWNLLVGNKKLIIENHSTSDIDNEQATGTTVYVAVKFESATAPICVYRIELSDTPRPEARDVIQQLGKRGIVCFLLTGDHASAAQKVAREVGIPSSRAIAGVSPLEKREYLQKLRQQYEQRGRTAFVGDGVNDAPALASADVSISLSSASDIAISSAAFILVNADLYSIIIWIDMSKLIYRRIKFNYGWAIVFNIIAIPIAAGILYPYHHFVLSPAWASLAMALSSISVVMSSFALKLQAPTKKLAATR